MEERDPIDDVFKDRSEQQSFDVPDSFLKDLDSRLDQLDGKRKSRKFLWFLLLLPIGVLCYFILFSNQTTSKKKANQTAQNRSNKMESVSDEISNEKLSNNETGDAQIILESTIKESLVTFDSTAYLMNAGLVKSTNTERTKSNMTQIQSKNKNLAQALPNKLERPQDKVSETGATIKTLSDAVSIETSVHQPKTKSSDATKVNNVETLNSISDSTIKPNLVNLIATSEEVFKDPLSPVERESADLVGQTNSKNEGAVFDPNSQSNLEAVHALDSSGVKDAAKPTAIENNETVVDTLKTKVIEPSDENQVLAKEVAVVSDAKSKVGQETSKWSHEIQLSGGIMNSYSRRTIVNTSSLWGPTYGAVYNLTVNNFDIGAGVAFNSTGENYSFPIINSILLGDQLDSVTISYGLDSVFIDNQQVWEVFEDSIPIVDSIFSPVYDNETVVIAGRNKLDWINIPLRFGYRLQIGSFTVIPRVSLDLGFAAGKNNSFYQTLLNEPIMSYQSRRFVLSYALQIEIRKDFDRLHVFMNPYFRSNVTPAVSYGLQNNRYNSWGINAGIGFVLNPSPF